MSIYKKLHERQKHVRGLGKDSKSFGYQYTSGTKVLSYVRPKMDELGLILKQEIISIENDRMDYSTKNGNKSEILTKVLMKFTWIDVETNEVDVNLFGANGQNDWEKGLGSALTYAERYFLLKYFHISTDEDDIDNINRKIDKVDQVHYTLTDLEFIYKKVSDRLTDTIKNRVIDIINKQESTSYEKAIKTLKSYE